MLKLVWSFDVRHDFRLKTVCFHLFCKGSCFINVSCIIDAYRCQTRFHYDIVFVSFNSNTMGVTSEAGTINLMEHLSSLPVFSRVCIAQSLVFYVVFRRSLFAVLFLSFDTASEFPFGILQHRNPVSKIEPLMPWYCLCEYDF